MDTVIHGIESRLLHIIQSDLLQTPAGFGIESDLFSSGLDSMAIMQLLLLVEDEFQVVIPVESVSRENFKTARAVAALVHERGGSHHELPSSQSGGGSTAAQLTASNPVVVETDALCHAGFDRLPLQETDFFVAGFDEMLRGAGQAGHSAHSVLELSSLPDMASLSALIAALPEKFPLLTAILRRPWGVGLPEWRPAAVSQSLELCLWSQEGSPGRLRDQLARPFTDLHASLEEIINMDLPRRRQAWVNARFHLLELAGGGCVFVFSWSHVILDGVGAELFLTELAHLAGGSPQGKLPPYATQPGNDARGWGPRFRAVPPLIWRFYEMLEKPFGCLGNRKFAPGRTQYQVVTLTREQTAEVTKRSMAVSGPLINMPFHLACAMRAHWRVFQHRGETPASLLASVPVQVRKKGALGPVFQNHLTMFFGTLEPRDLESIDLAAHSLQEQHERFVRDGLDDAFRDLMWIMRPLPPRQHIRFIEFKMGGLLSSFYHSNTGAFAPGLNTFLGAPIDNAYHVPGISNPPGTGIFASEKHGRLVLTLCWKDGALNETERKVFLDQLFTDMGVTQV